MCRESIYNVGFDVPIYNVTVVLKITMRAVSSHKPFENADQSRLCMWLLGTVPHLATRRLDRIAEELANITSLTLTGNHIRIFEEKVPLFSDFHFQQFK